MYLLLLTLLTAPFAYANRRSTRIKSEAHPSFFETMLHGKHGESIDDIKGKVYDKKYVAANFQRIDMANKQMAAETADLKNGDEKLAADIKKRNDTIRENLDKITSSTSNSKNQLDANTELIKTDKATESKNYKDFKTAMTKNNNDIDKTNEDQTQTFDKFETEIDNETSADEDKIDKTSDKLQTASTNKNTQIGTLLEGQIGQVSQQIEQGEAKSEKLIDKDTSLSESDAGKTNDGMEKDLQSIGKSVTDQENADETLTSSLQNGYDGLNGQLKNSLEAEQENTAEEAKLLEDFKKYFSAATDTSKNSMEAATDQINKQTTETTQGLDSEIKSFDADGKSSLNDLSTLLSTALGKSATEVVDTFDAEKKKLITELAKYVKTAEKDKLSLAGEMNTADQSEKNFEASTGKALLNIQSEDSSTAASEKNDESVIRNLAESKLDNAFAALLKTFNDNLKADKKTIDALVKKAYDGISSQMNSEADTGKTKLNKILADFTSLSTKSADTSSKITNFKNSADSKVSSEKTNIETRFGDVAKEEQEINANFKVSVDAEKKKIENLLPDANEKVKSQLSQSFSSQIAVANDEAKGAISKASAKVAADEKTKSAKITKDAEDARSKITTSSSEAAGEVDSAVSKASGLAKENLGQSNTRRANLDDKVSGAGDSVLEKSKTAAQANSQSLEKAASSYSQSQGKERDNLAEDAKRSKESIGAAASDANEAIGNSKAKIDSAKAAAKKSAADNEGSIDTASKDERTKMDAAEKDNLRALAKVRKEEVDDASRLAKYKSLATSKAGEIQSILEQIKSGKISSLSQIEMLSQKAIEIEKVVTDEHSKLVADQQERDASVARKAEIERSGDSKESSRVRDSREKVSKDVSQITSDIDAGAKKLDADIAKKLSESDASVENLTEKSKTTVTRANRDADASIKIASTETDKFEGKFAEATAQHKEKVTSLTAKAEAVEETETGKLTKLQTKASDLSTNLDNVDGQAKSSIAETDDEAAKFDKGKASLLKSIEDKRSSIKAATNSDLAKSANARKGFDGVLAGASANAKSEEGAAESFVDSVARKEVERRQMSDALSAKNEGATLRKIQDGSKNLDSKLTEAKETIVANGKDADSAINSLAKKSEDLDRAAAVLKAKWDSDKGTLKNYEQLVEGIIGRAQSQIAPIEEKVGTYVSTVIALAESVLSSVKNKVDTRVGSEIDSEQRVNKVMDDLTSFVKTSFPEIAKIIGESALAESAAAATADAFVAAKEHAESTVEGDEQSATDRAKDALNSSAKDARKKAKDAMDTSEADAKSARAQLQSKFKERSDNVEAEANAASARLEEISQNATSSMDADGQKYTTVKDQLKAKVQSSISEAGGLKTSVEKIRVQMEKNRKGLEVLEKIAKST